MNWDKSSGCHVWMNGRKYLDFTSSIFTQNFGHNNPYVNREIRKQLKKCVHAYGYDTEIKKKYIAKLRELIGWENILLYSTGAEAIEAAIKIGLNNKSKCVGIQNAMHGRTAGAEALVGKRNTQKIKYCSDLLYYKPTNDAIFIEGYRGYDCKQLTTAEIEYLIELQANNLIIFDEIQSGFYRTNNRFIYIEYGIIPDILVIGKSMGGGLPLSAVCWNKPLNLNGLELTSTHSGQPLQMAAGYGILKYIEEKLNPELYNENIKLMNSFFDSLKTEHNNIGMVGAIKCDSEDLFYRACLNARLIVTKTGRGWIKIAPPVVISKKELTHGLEILSHYVN